MIVDKEFEDIDNLAPLVDIDNYYGRSSKRMMPIIMLGLVGGVPCLIYAQFFLQVIPMKIFLILFSIWIIRWSLIIIGEEPKRLEQYKRQIAEVYESAGELMMIKRIHDDGLIEYMNGRVKYLLVVENSAELDVDTVHSNYYRLITGLTDNGYIPDVYLQNIVGETTLDTRYSKLQFDTNSDASRAYLDIIDYNIELEKNFSLVVRTIFAIKGTRGDYIDMKEKIEQEIASGGAHKFKDLHIADKDEVGVILSRDIMMDIDFQELNREKYKTEDYRGCSVISFDAEAIKILKGDGDLQAQEEKKKSRGFMKKYE